MQSATVSSADRMFFTEQLSLLLETGENLHGALTTIATQTNSPKMQTVVRQLAQDIGEGKSFAYALRQHEEVFSSTYCNLIAASENGGFLHEVLLQLLDMEQRQEELRSTLVSAATYPAFLIAFSLAVVVFVLVFVFPKFGAMFASIYDQLPTSTRLLMSISDSLRQYWLVFLIGILAVAVAVRLWLVSDRGRARVDRWKLHTPGVCAIFIQIYLVQCMRVLSLSIRNGVSITQSLDACRGVVANSLFRKLIDETHGKVLNGAGVAAGFADAEFVPDLAKHMIETGEQTGNLGKVLGRIADYYEIQLTKKLEALSKLAEPLMLLVMGVIVGILVSSLILPIFMLSRATS